MLLSSTLSLNEKRIFLTMFAITFVIFVFTNDAHRYSFDEDLAHRQTMQIITQTPNPLYVEGKSTLYFDYPELFPPSTLTGPICKNAILCTNTFIGHPVTEIPFVFINHIFHIVKQDTVVLTTNDFSDGLYVWWRNNQNPDLTFMELFYGPTFSALSVGVFFLISRTYGVSEKNSVLLSFLYGLTTMAWAYSKTSLNAVPMTFFILLGFYFFRRYENSRSCTSLILCGFSMGFGFLTRPDAAFFIVPLFVFFLISLKKQTKKIKKIVSFMIPLLISYGIYQLIDFIRFGTSVASGVSSTSQAIASTPFGVSSATLYGALGLLFSPGVGLFVYSPILLSAFFSFYDFFKKDKRHCILFIVFASYFIIHYGGGESWHGLVAWGARYLLPITPFLLLPLGISIEKRKKMHLKIILLSLAAIGFLFNVVYASQDVSWFVWGQMGSSDHGLYILGSEPNIELRIHPVTIWTFEYSQLTLSTKAFFDYFQPDIFLLKLFGPLLFAIILAALLIPMSYKLLKFLKIPNY